MPEPAGEVVHRGARDRIPVPRRAATPAPVTRRGRLPPAATAAATDRVARHQLDRRRRERRSAAVALPAPGLPARARPPVGHDLQVPQLGSHPERAPVQHAVQQQRGADAGAERHEHRGGRTGRRAEVPLGQRGRVRVVLDDDGQPDPGRDPVGHRSVPPRQVRREPHHPPVGRDEARPARARRRRSGACPRACSPRPPPRPPAPSRYGGWGCGRYRGRRRRR